MVGSGAQMVDPDDVGGERVRRRHESADLTGVSSTSPSGRRRHRRRTRLDSATIRVGHLVGFARWADAAVPDVVSRAVLVAAGMLTAACRGGPVPGLVAAVQTYFRGSSAWGWDRSLSGNKKLSKTSSPNNMSPSTTGRSRAITTMTPPDEAVITGTRRQELLVQPGPDRQTAHARHESV